MQQDITTIVLQAKQLLNTSGYPYAKITSVIADEKESVWKIKADVGVIVKDLKELKIDDRTKKVIYYH